jgi:hypothetical protein
MRKILFSVDLFGLSARIVPKVFKVSLLHEDEAKLLAVLDSMKLEAGHGARSKEKHLKPGHGLA